MNEIFDKLLIKFLITVFVLLVVFIYKYGQRTILNRSKAFALKDLFPHTNTAHAVHITARILGLAIVLSDFSFYLSDGLFLALFDFLLYSLFLIILYSLSLYIFDSIALYNFNFEDEIYKRKNMSFSCTTFGISISSAFILKKIFLISQGSLINLLFLWLFTTVLFGFALKSYLFITQKNLNQALLQENIFDSLSHVGFCWSWTLLINAALDVEILSYTRFMTFTIIQLILSIIIFPIFYIGISRIFGVKKHLIFKKGIQGKDGSILQTSDRSGFFDSLLFLTTAFFTSMITGQIHFGTFYPPL